MSWTRLAATVSAAVLVGWATCAMALDDEYGRSGPYLGAGGLYAFEDFSGSPSATTPDGSWGYDLKGGYRFNEYFALEVGWQHMVSFDDPAGDTELWMVAANGKVYPFYGIIQPYALFGLGFCGVDDSRAASSRDTTGFGMRFGGGLDVYITRNWAVSVEAGYFLPTGGRSNYGAVPITFGILYRFY